MDYQEKLVEIVCHRCEFFKPSEQEDLKCGAFLLLMQLLDDGVISLEELEKLSA